MRTKRKLDRRTTKEIERLLAERRAALAAAMRNQMARRRAEEGGRFAEETDWATETLHAEIEVAIIDQRSRQVGQIEAALERLGRGEYGFCRDCGEFIGLARLRALPFALRCSPCQARAERGPHAAVAVGSGAGGSDD